jgi:hypothetical protein
VRMKCHFLLPFWAENAGLLTGRCDLRYCGMAPKSTAPDHGERKSGQMRRL